MSLGGIFFYSRIRLWLKVASKMVKALNINKIKRCEWIVNTFSVIIRTTDISLRP